MDRYTANDVRDRRTKIRFEVDKRIITQWAAILEAEGVALYVFYVALAALGQSVPGLRQIGAILGMSQRYIVAFNRVLVWAELIEVERGRDGAANAYNLLDVPEVSPGLIEHIRRECLADDVMSATYSRSFREKLLARLDKWRPWRPQTIIPESYRVYVADMPTTNGNGHGAAPQTPAPAGTVLEKLIALSFKQSKAEAIIEEHGEDHIAAWLRWIDYKLVTEPGYFKRTPSGYLLTVLGQTPQEAPELLPAGHKRCNCGAIIPDYVSMCDDCKDRFGLVS